MPVQAKLAAAWTSFMFLYVYVDILAFYKPGVVDDILVGIVWEFDISQTWVTVFARAHGDPDLHGRAVDDAARPGQPHHEPHRGLGTGPLAAFNAVGESWTYFYVLGVALEVIVLALILRYAWTWPRRTASPATLAASLDSEPLRTPQQA